MAEEVRGSSNRNMSENVFLVYQRMYQWCIKDWYVDKAETRRHVTSHHVPFKSGVKSSVAQRRPYLPLHGVSDGDTGARSHGRLKEKQAQRTRARVRTKDVGRTRAN